MDNSDLTSRINLLELAIQMKDKTLSDVSQQFAKYQEKQVRVLDGHQRDLRQVLDILMSRSKDGNMSLYPPLEYQVARDDSGYVGGSQISLDKISSDVSMESMVEQVEKDEEAKEHKDEGRNFGFIFMRL